MDDFVFGITLLLWFVVMSVVLAQLLTVAPLLEVVTVTGLHEGRVMAGGLFDNGPFGFVVVVLGVMILVAAATGVAFTWLLAMLVIIVVTLLFVVDVRI